MMYSPWVKTRWHRLIGEDGRLLAESSDRAELEKLRERDGGVIERMWKRSETRWVVET